MSLKVCTIVPTSKCCSNDHLFNNRIHVFMMVIETQRKTIQSELSPRVLIYWFCVHSVDCAENCYKFYMQLIFQKTNLIYIVAKHLVSFTMLRDMQHVLLKAIRLRNYCERVASIIWKLVLKTIKLWRASDMQSDAAVKGYDTCSRGKDDRKYIFPFRIKPNAFISLFYRCVFKMPYIQFWLSI